MSTTSFKFSKQVIRLGSDGSTGSLCVKGWNFNSLKVTTFSSSPHFCARSFSPFTILGQLWNGMDESLCVYACVRAYIRTDVSIFLSQISKVSKTKKKIWSDRANITGSFTGVNLQFQLKTLLKEKEIYLTIKFRPKTIPFLACFWHIPSNTIGNVFVCYIA